MEPSKASEVTVSPSRTYYAIVDNVLEEFTLPDNYTGNNSRGAFKWYRSIIAPGAKLTMCVAKESYLEQQPVVEEETPAETE